MPVPVHSHAHAHAHAYPTHLLTTVLWHHAFTCRVPCSRLCGSSRIPRCARPEGGGARGHPLRLGLVPLGLVLYIHGHMHRSWCPPPPLAWEPPRSSPLRHLLPSLLSATRCGFTVPATQDHTRTRARAHTHHIHRALHTAFHTAFTSLSHRPSLHMHTQANIHMHMHTQAWNLCADRRTRTRTCIRTPRARAYAHHVQAHAHVHCACACTCKCTTCACPCTCTRACT